MTRGERTTPGGNTFDPEGPSWALTEKARSWVVALSSKAGGQWWWQQPSTTLGGDPRVSPRCHHDEGMQGKNALPAAAAGLGDDDQPIRLTVRDALTLQSFDPAYPVQGTKTKKFEQIGNAVPPVLARAVLAQFVNDAATEPYASTRFVERTP